MERKVQHHMQMDKRLEIDRVYSMISRVVRNMVRVILFVNGESLSHTLYCWPTSQCYG